MPADGCPWYEFAEAKAFARCWTLRPGPEYLTCYDDATDEFVFCGQDWSEPKRAGSPVSVADRRAQAALPRPTTGA